MAELALNERLETDRRFINGITYRLDRHKKSGQAIADESISDIPHLKDLTESVIEASTALLRTDIISVLGVLPKLVLSGVGVYAAVPNIRTIWLERQEHLKELRSTLSLYRDYLKEHHQTDIVARKGGLVLEGIPYTHVKALNPGDLQKAWRLTHSSLLKRVSSRLRNPEPEILAAAANGAWAFGRHTVKSILLNLTTRSRLSEIFRSGVLGVRNAERCFFSQKDEIDDLAHLRTVGEKITAVQSAGGAGGDYITLQGRAIAYKMLDKDLVQRLDEKRISRREKARQLQVAARGFALQSAFIAASVGLTVYHLATMDWGGAALQFSSASLAANPFIFVGEQSEQLYAAIYSQAAEEDEILSQRLEDMLYLEPVDDESPDLTAE